MLVWRMRGGLAGTRAFDGQVYGGEEEFGWANRGRYVDTGGPANSANGGWTDMHCWPWPMRMLMS